MTDRGSAVILMPAGILIALVLGSIAVDFSALHLAQRELTSAAEAAVNDAVTFGLDQERLRAGEGFRLDARRVDQAVRRAVAAAQLGVVDVRVEVVGSTTVRVSLRQDVRLVFAPIVPGIDESPPVRAYATATLRSAGPS